MIGSPVMKSFPFYSSSPYDREHDREHDRDRERDRTWRDDDDLVLCLC